MCIFKIKNKKEKLSKYAFLIRRYGQLDNPFYFYDLKYERPSTQKIDFRCTIIGTKDST